MGLRLIDVKAKIRRLHRESPARELLDREAESLERMILANGDEMKAAYDELEKF